MAICVQGWRSSEGVAGRSAPTGGLRGDVVDEAVARDRARGTAEAGPVVEVCGARLIDRLLHGEGDHAGRDLRRQLERRERVGDEDRDIRAARRQEPQRGPAASTSHGCGGWHRQAHAAVDRQHRGAPAIERDRRGRARPPEPHQLDERELRGSIRAVVGNRPAERFAPPRAQARVASRLVDVGLVGVERVQSRAAARRGRPRSRRVRRR